MHKLGPWKPDALATSWTKRILATGTSVASMLNVVAIPFQLRRGPGAPRRWLLEADEPGICAISVHSTVERVRWWADAGAPTLTLVRVRPAPSGRRLPGGAAQDRIGVLVDAWGQVALVGE